METSNRVSFKKSVKEVLTEEEESKREKYVKLFLNNLKYNP